MIRTLALAIALVAALVGTASAQDSQKGFDAYKRGDYAAALREWRPLAEQGHAKAQSILGSMYDDGQGVPQDYAEAARRYRKAAEQGYAFAWLKLGSMYGIGEGVP